MPTRAPYGSWKSPITTELITAGRVSLSEPRFSDGNLYWLEGRPAEKGRVVVVERDASGRIADRSPKDVSVRTRVHEYGGGAWVVHGNTLYYSELSSQQIFRLDAGADPVPITPAPEPGIDFRYADGGVTPDGKLLISVRETHRAGGDVVNDIVAVPTDGKTRPKSLVAGADFYSFPRINREGDRLLWTCWFHPQMPWDGTELWVADLDPSGPIDNARRIAGGRDESIFGPDFGPDGHVYFVSDRSGWWNIYVERDGPPQNLLPMDAEFGAPQWVFGLTRYAFLDASRLACIYTEDGQDRAAVLDVRTGSLEPMELPYTAFDGIASDREGRVAVIGASPAGAPELTLVEPRSAEADVVRQSFNLNVPSGFISTPEHLAFEGFEGRTSYAFFYAPANPGYEAEPGGRPPLLVLAHSGPTASANVGLNLGIQFWTSRGFGVVDVNYGGSTGYGREYRDRLRGRWGVMDPEDCIQAARYLARTGRVDGTRIVIRGKSAAGLTALSALIGSDTFAAGASYYGVIDIERLTGETHKFEARYNDTLIGSYPEMKDLYRERSPISHADDLARPVIVLQGLEDKVVPPSQAELLVDVLRRKKIPFAYLTFEEEGHGFRLASSIRRALEAELYFYSRILDFKPAEVLTPITIENL